MISNELFGHTSAGQAVDRFTLDNGRMRVHILTYGGILQAVEVPDRRGERANVSLGFDNLADYERRSPYFGCITGRYANRIAGGEFTLDGVGYRLSLNEGPHCLHGGTAGFDKRIWAATGFSDGDAVGLRLELTSPRGDQGFPGTLTTAVTYTLTGDNEIRIDYQATTDAVTVVNLTNHSYFNLAGEGVGTVDQHELFINAAGYHPVDAALIPLGHIDPVSRTPMDFTSPTPVGARLGSDFEQLALGLGYDHNYVIDRQDPSGSQLELAARVTDPGSGRTLTVLTTEPAVQFYGGNRLDGTLVGTSGAPYHRGGGLALETQHFPDSPNQPAFPSTTLRPGEEYRSTTVYRFTAE